MQYLLSLIALLGGLVLYLKVKNNSAEALLSLFKFKSDNADSERDINRLQGNLDTKKQGLKDLSDDLNAKKKEKPTNAKDLADWLDKH